ncbi:MAG: hypothetical protein LBB18_02100 [Puniceicoccales bacterium]|nr:hypothetical protein [Puniceicoccales bacterium]
MAEKIKTGIVATSYVGMEKKCFPDRVSSKKKTILTTQVCEFAKDGRLQYPTKPLDERRSGPMWYIFNHFCVIFHNSMDMCVRARSEFQKLSVAEVSRDVRETMGGDVKLINDSPGLVKRGTRRETAKKIRNFIRKVTRHGKSEFGIWVMKHSTLVSRTPSFKKCELPKKLSIPVEALNTHVIGDRAM